MKLTPDRVRDPRRADEPLILRQRRRRPRHQHQQEAEGGHRAAAASHPLPGSHGHWSHWSLYSEGWGVTECL